MRIIVHGYGLKRPITIPMPTKLLLSPLTGLVAGCATKMTIPQALHLMRTLRSSAKLMKGTPMVEVEDAGGSHVTIFL